MVRAGGKKVRNAPQAADPVAEEQKRLKKLAFSKGMLSETPLKAAAVRNALRPSKTVVKHSGKDIIRKSQRSRNRFLFSFPGLLAPVSGGKIGMLKDLDTKNPILYLDFPLGQMKLFGTIVYPKNRYLTLQFSRGGKSVVCDDYFDNMIVFSDAWWIGRKDENPEELRLEFPKELNVDKTIEHNFKGGAGAASDGKQGTNKTGMRLLEQESPKLEEEEEEDDILEDQSNVKEFSDIAPARHSARTAGKTFNFADVSSEDDLTANDAETSDKKERREEKFHASAFDGDNKDVVILDRSADKSKPGAEVVSKSTGHTHSNHGSLIQATISTMFKKVGEKTVSSKKGSISEETKAGRKITLAKKQSESIAKSADAARVYTKNTKASGSNISTQRREKTRSVLDPSSSTPIDSSQAEDEEIEEFSSTSQDMDESDEDWIA
ncbi:unnamed protein product [Cuscuta campestris]|uniref:DNA-binding protein RHL1 n=1 Tax=Cuscuta campestris TaxID=132261 RepID=A0A484LNE8_9ASTE|nr:unnamed protein product [Cuscuta campestris]